MSGVGNLLSVFSEYHERENSTGRERLIEVLWLGAQYTNTLEEHWNSVTCLLCVGRRLPHSYNPQYWGEYQATE
jgi:hypothetical protein